MNVLFVGSGNKNINGSPIIRNQGESLKKKGAGIDYFFITGKGLTGYLSNVYKLRKFINEHEFDIIHAHYGISGIVSLLSAKGRKLVVSFMGDDILGSDRDDGTKTILSLFTAFINSRFFAKFYDAIIVKTSKMLAVTGSLKKTFLIPNGVDLEMFKQMDKDECLEKLSWKKEEYHILFPADPGRTEKNYALACKAIEEIKDRGTINLHTMKDMPHRLVPVIMNASDVVILTSFHEGSPNAVKEAMACNRPVVAVNTGDSEMLLKETEGCFLSSYEPKDLSEYIRKAIFFTESGHIPGGRKRIKDLGLDSDTVAEKILAVYELVMKGQL